MLQALVEEMNRYDESPQEALVMLNSKPEFEEEQHYEVTVIDTESGKLLTKNDFYPNRIRGNPLSSRFSIGVYKNDDDEDDEDLDLTTDSSGNVIPTTRAKRNTSLTLSSKNLTNIDTKQRTFTFSDGMYTIILKKEEEKTYGFIDF